MADTTHHYQVSSRQGSRPQAAVFAIGYLNLTPRHLLASCSLERSHTHYSSSSIDGATVSQWSELGGISSVFKAAPPLLDLLAEENFLTSVQVISWDPVEDFQRYQVRIDQRFLLVSLDPGADVRQLFEISLKIWVREVRPTRVIRRWIDQITLAKQTSRQLN